MFHLDYWAWILINQLWLFTQKLFSVSFIKVCFMVQKTFSHKTNKGSYLVTLLYVGGQKLNSSNEGLWDICIFVLFSTALNLSSWEFQHHFVLHIVNKSWMKLPFIINEWQFVIVYLLLVQFFRCSVTSLLFLLSEAPWSGLSQRNITLCSKVNKKLLCK